MSESNPAQTALQTIAKATAEPERESTATKLVKNLLHSESRPELFHDERGVCFLRLHNSPPRSVRLRSMEFRSLLSGLWYEAEEKAPGSEALTSAITVLQHIALNGSKVLPGSGHMHILHNRVAFFDGAIWLDLADEKWRAIRITSEAWSVEEKPPILFRRFAHQLPLPEPVSGGDPWKLLTYLNVKSEDQPLFMSYIGTLFVPEIPHAVLDIHGPQGSTKTTLMELVKALLDPSALGVQTIPRDERELVQCLDHNYLAFFDNVSTLQDWVSDSLCKATTGIGFSKRQLYTDDEDVIYRIVRPVGLNGINVAAQRPDLLDRSLLIGLDQVPDERRRKITEVKTAFAQDHAEILGGFLDALVAALRLPEPKFSRTFRMADFASWGCRFAEPLGLSQADFIEAYARNIEQQAEEAVRGDIVGELLLEHLETTVDKQMHGTATELLSILRGEAETLHVSTRQRDWPKSSTALAKRMRVLKDSLGKIGYRVDFTRPVHGGKRIITIEYQTERVLRDASTPSPPSEGLGKVATDTSPASPLSPVSGVGDVGDARDTTFETFPESSEKWGKSSPLDMEKAGQSGQDGLGQSVQPVKGSEDISNYMVTGEIISEAIQVLREKLPILRLCDFSEVVKYLQGRYGREVAEGIAERLKPRLQTNPEGYLELV